jgi:hypothetical protein
MSTAIRLSKAQKLRAQLEHLRARYDHGAVDPAIFEAIKQIEVKIAWSEHHAQEQSCSTGANI